MTALLGIANAFMKVDDQSNNPPSQRLPEDPKFAVGISRRGGFSIVNIRARLRLVGRYFDLSATHIVFTNYPRLYRVSDKMHRK